MSGIASVNLTLIKTKIAANSGDVPSQLAHQILALSGQSDGPLRVHSESENGVTVKYLGVRSWRNFFLETFFCSAKERASEAIMAVSEIEKAIRPFLQKHNGTTYPNFEKIATDLNCKATGKDLSLPSVERTVRSNGALKSLQPDFNMPSKLASNRIKTFYGNTVIPSGITIGKISVDNVITKLRSITSYSAPDIPSGLSTRSKYIQRSKTLIAQTAVSAAEFKVHYLAQLNLISDEIDFSVALELETSNQGICSKANLQGAYDAAVEFVALMKLKGKEVSVFLSTPTLHDGIQRTKS